MIIDLELDLIGITVKHNRPTLLISCVRLRVRRHCVAMPWSIALWITNEMTFECIIASHRISLNCFLDTKIVTQTNCRGLWNGNCIFRMMHDACAQREKSNISNKRNENINNSKKKTKGKNVLVFVAEKNSTFSIHPIKRGRLARFRRYAKIELWFGCISFANQH